MRRAWSSAFAVAVAVAVAVVAVAALWFLQAPPRTAQAYTERASDTAATLRSQVETARIWARTVADGRTLLTAAAVGLEEADDDASTALSDFEQLDPPVGTGASRESVVAAGRDAIDALSTLRIAAHRGDWARVERSGEELAALGARLEALERSSRP